MRTMLIILTMCVSVAVADEIAEQAKSLKGLEAVAMEVDIRYLPTAKRYGLRSYEIAKKMKDMLEENGIHPMTAKEQEKAPDCPLLRITVIPMIDEKYNACSISIDMELKQTVKLESDPSVTVKGVATWQRNAASLINVKMLLPAVSERVDTYLKEFIDDWLTTNGKPARYKKEKVESEVNA